MLKRRTRWAGASACGSVASRASFSRIGFPAGMDPCLGPPSGLKRPIGRDWGIAQIGQVWMKRCTATACRFYRVPCPGLLPRPGFGGSKKRPRRTIWAWDLRTQIRKVPGTACSAAAPIIPIDLTDSLGDRVGNNPRYRARMRFCPEVSLFGLAGKFGKRISGLYRCQSFRLFPAVKFQDFEG